MTRDSKVELLLAAMVHSDILFLEIVTHLDTDIFDQNEYNGVMKQLKRYYEKENRKPTVEEFRLFVTSNEEWASYAEFILDVFETVPQISENYARKQFYSYFQRFRTLGYIESIGRRLDSGNFDVKEAFSEMKKVAEATIEPSKDYIELRSDNIVDIYRRARDKRAEETSPLIF